MQNLSPARGYGDANVAAAHAAGIRGAQGYARDALCVLFGLLKRVKLNLIITAFGRTTNFRRMYLLFTLLRIKATQYSQNTAIVYAVTLVPHDKLIHNRVIFYFSKNAVLLISDIKMN